MKKLIALLSVIALFSVFSINAQNLLDNPGFEGSFNAILGTPADWSGVGCSKETGIVFSGNNACRVKGSSTAKLGQGTGLIPNLKAGDSYELSFHYYVVAHATSGADIRMNSSWGGGNVDATHDQTLLKAEFSGTQLEQWETKTIVLTVPINALSFTVSVSIPAGAIVIFDDFDFHKVTMPVAEPAITITPAATQTFPLTNINATTTKTVVVTTANLTNAVTISFTGDDATYFSASPATLLVTDTQTVTITYAPLTAGAHTATMVVGCGGCTLSATSNNTLDLSGSAATPLPTEPAITITPAAMQTFPLTNINTTATKTVMVTTANLTNAVTISFTGDDAAYFSASPSTLLAVDTQTVTITYAPLTAGAHTATMVVECGGCTLSATSNNTLDLSGSAATPQPTEPAITITPAATQTFPLTNINTTATKTVVVTTANLPNAAVISFGGTHNSYFSASPTSVPANATTTVTISYLPTAVGTHSANMVVDCGNCNLSAASNNVLFLSGSATDPAAVPTVTIAPTSHTFNTKQIGQRDTAEFIITSENIASSTYLGARLINANNKFKVIGSTSVQKNTTASIKYEFTPNEIGTFTAQLEIYDMMIGSAPALASATLSGTGVGIITPPEKQGDQYPLDDANPLAWMIESFDSVTHNQPFSIPQWKNIAEENYRAFWGYDFKDDNQNIINKAAKVTAFNSTNPAPDAYEMWLYTPPLDFVNAQSKIFTFKLMGDNLAEDNLADFEVYYVVKDEPLYKEKIEMDIPQTSDYNNVWIPYTIDFSNQNLEDVFFIGFRFYAEHGGIQNSVIYYIDSVTWSIQDTVPNAIAKITENPVIAWFTDSKIFISAENSGSAALYDISGSMLTEYNFSNGVSEFPAHFSAGVYFLRTKCNDKYLIKKIIIM